MPELKPGWTRVRFGDVVRQVKDKMDPVTSGLKRYVAGEHMGTDDLRIRHWGEIGDGYLGPAFHMRFRPGHVLYGSRRTYLRKVAVADFEGICANTTFVLESADPNKLLPELLPFIMKTETFHQHSIRESKGSVNPYVNFSDLAWFEFVLPPVDEQRRLTKLLRAIEETHEYTLQVLSEAVTTYRSVLWNSYRHITKFSSLDEHSVITSGGTPNRGEKSYWGGTIPWVKTAEINYKDIINTEEYISETGLANSSAKLLPAGTILMALYGQGPTLGRVARLAIDAATNQACAAIQLFSEIDSDFVYYWLVRQYEFIRRKARGATQPNLNLSIVRSLEIPSISLQEQRDIVTAVMSIEKIVSCTQERLLKVKRHQRFLIESTLGGILVH